MFVFADKITLEVITADERCYLAYLLKCDIKTHHFTHQHIICSVHITFATDQICLNKSRLIKGADISQ